MTDTEMRAARYDRYGGPEVLGVATVPVPRPARGEVLIRVHATSVNAADLLIRSGGMKLMTGRRFPKGIGADVAGELAAHGPGTTAPPVGTPVWGALNALKGTASAQYVVARAKEIAPAPDSLGLVESAALPTAGLIALQALRAARARAGGRALIVGAAGGVGTALVQLAHAQGLSVTAVTSVANSAQSGELGADRTFDYVTLDPARLDRDFDVVDTYGEKLGAYRRLLRPRGRIVTLSQRGLSAVLRSCVTPGPRVRMKMLKRGRADLEALAGFVDRGELRPVIERVYPLEQLAEAHRAAETGHAAGKRVIRVAGPA